MLCGSYRRKCDKTNDKYQLKSCVSIVRVCDSQLKDMQARKVFARSPKIPATNCVRILLDSVSSL